MNKNIHSHSSTPCSFIHIHSFVNSSLYNSLKNTYAYTYTQFYMHTNLQSYMHTTIQYICIQSWNIYTQTHTSLHAYNHSNICIPMHISRHMHIPTMIIHSIVHAYTYYHTYIKHRHTIRWSNIHMHTIEHQNWNSRLW